MSIIRQRGIYGNMKIIQFNMGIYIFTFIFFFKKKTTKYINKIHRLIKKKKKEFRMITKYLNK